MPIQVTIHGDNKGTIAETVVINNYSQQPSHPQSQTKDIEEAEIVPDVKIPSFFRTNAQSITKIQAKWQEALGNTTKTAVIRFVKGYDYTDGYFKLAGTYEQLAEAFNEAQDKFVFTANDFENANKPLKK
jgi:hypothetical protein